MDSILSTFRLALGDALVSESNADAARYFRLLTIDQQHCTAKDTAGLLTALKLVDDKSVESTRNLAVELLNLGRLHHFISMSGLRRFQVVKSLYRLNACEAVFILDDFNSDGLIWWVQVNRDVSFDEFNEWWLKKRFDEHYNNGASIELRKSLHRYITSSTCSTDCDTAKDEHTKNCGIDDPYFVQTVLALAEKFGAQKVISVLDDVLENISTSTVTLVRIVDSEHDFTGYPMHWILKMIVD